MTDRYKRKIPATAKDTICLLYRQGKTLQEISDLFGASRERVRQLLRKWGVDQDTGGIHLRAFVNQSQRRIAKLERKAKRIAKIEAFFQCSYDEVARIGGADSVSPWMARKNNARGPIGAFVEQRYNSQRRGIGWNLSFPEWWRIWQESGHWEERGRGPGYCMARHGDSGPYSVDNVYICTIGQNFSDSWLVTPASKRFPNASKRDAMGLSDLERQTVQLRDQGLSWRQTAERLNRTESSIHWAHWNAKKKLALVEAA